MTNKCGTCTLCCKLLRIPELDKPVNKWCNLVQLGKPPDYKRGCSIYETRPESCRVYECAYLTYLQTAEPLPEYCRPDNLHIVFSAAASLKFITAHVDPTYPDAWKTPRTRALIDTFVEEIRPVLIIISEEQCYLVADRKTTLLTKEAITDLFTVASKAV